MKLELTMAKLLTCNALSFYCWTPEVRLKTQWKISTGVASKKKLFIVGLEGPRGLVFSEIGIRTSSEDLATLYKNLLVSHLSEYLNWVAQFDSFGGGIYDLNSLWDQSFGSMDTELKSALLNLALKYYFGQNLSSLADQFNFQIPEFVPTSFSLPIAKISYLKEFFVAENLNRFSFVKIKINSQTKLEDLVEIQSWGDFKIRLDGNQGFSDVDSLRLLIERLDKKRLQFVEQPFPEAQECLYKAWKQLNLAPVLADESLQDQNIPMHWQDIFDGINIKLVKSGGWLKSIEQIRQARSMGLKVMIGCMVESSIGIEEAFFLSGLADFVDLDGFALIENEPFKCVKEDGGLIRRSNKKLNIKSFQSLQALD